MNADEKRIVALIVVAAYLLGGIASYVALNFNTIFHITKEVARTDRMSFTQNHINQSRLYRLNLNRGD